MKIEKEMFYKLIAPRPVVLITTTNLEGHDNAAPFSFIMPISMNPPIIGVSIGIERDTLRNILETKEFVVNIPSAELLEKLWKCSKRLPYGKSEIDEADLSREKSKIVKPPRIKECLAWIECSLNSKIDFGDHSFIAANVLLAECRDGVIVSNALNIEEFDFLQHISGRKFSVPKIIQEVSSG